MRDKMREELREENLLLKHENERLKARVEQLELPLEYPVAEKRIAFENNACAIPTDMK